MGSNQTSKVSVVELGSQRSNAGPHGPLVLKVHTRITAVKFLPATVQNIQK